MCDYHRNTLNEHHQLCHEDTVSSRAIIHAPLFSYLLLILVLGIPLNILVFYIYHYKVQSRIFGLFVELMSLYDMLYCCCMVPVIVTFKLLPDQLHHQSVCSFMTFSVLYSLITGGSILVIIAVQRERSVCHIGGKQIDIPLARRLCAATPLLGAIVSLPAVFPVKAEPEFVILPQKLINVTTYTCQLHPLSHSFMSLFVTIYIFTIIVLLCLILSMLYVAVWKSIRQQLDMSWRQGSGTSKVLAASEASTKVFFVLSIIFCLTHLPPPLFLIITSQLFPSTTTPRTWSVYARGVGDVASYLHLVNSVANPIVYGIWCQAFRTEFFKIFRCKNTTGQIPERNQRSIDSV